MINKLVIEAHKNAVEHGWWEEERSFGEQIALMHSELSEALEEFRNGMTFSETYRKCKNCRATVYPGQLPNIESLVCCGEPMKPEGIPVELADCIIRIFDTCGNHGIDLEDAIKVKMEYNKNRPYRHGGKVI